MKALAILALCLPLTAGAQFYTPPPRDYSIPAVTLTFDLPIEHSASWKSLAADRPAWRNDPSNYNMRWTGTLSFTPPYKGWFTETDFTFASDRTQPGTFTAYVSGFYGPGVEAYGVAGDYPNGYATLGVYWQQGGDYKNQELRLAFPSAPPRLSVPIATPVPEPETWAMLLAGFALLARRKVLRIGVQRRMRPRGVEEIDVPRGS